MGHVPLAVAALDEEGLHGLLGGVKGAVEFLMADADVVSLHFSVIFQEVGDDCFSVQMGVAQDGVFEGSQIILWHAAKEVGVAGFDASSESCVIPELHLVVGIAVCHFSRVVSSLPLNKLCGGGRGRPRVRLGQSDCCNPQGGLGSSCGHRLHCLGWRKRSGSLPA